MIIGHCYLHLSLGERRKIANRRIAKTPVSKIAAWLCRAPSTIHPIAYL
ncbi:helix-turn-helix domain-containing protein [Roseobacter sp. OBYS 0001]